MKYILLGITLCFFACTKEKEQTSDIEVSQDTLQAVLPIEATSFTGKPLYQREIDKKVKHKNDSTIAAIRAKESLNEYDFIDLSRAHASNYHYQKAIKSLTEGIALFPESFKLLRHRGHRYLNVRQPEKAIQDLVKADGLIGTEYVQEEELDYNGKPWGTYKFWVYYHIGIYHYLKGDYAKAAEAYKILVKNATTDKNHSGSRDWLYNTYQRMGEPELAQSILDEIDNFSIADTNYIYYKRLLFYKGILEENELLDKEKPIDQWNGTDMTLGYAIASNYLYQGDTVKAQAIFEKILSLPYWGAWAYVVTDAEQARLSK